MQMGWLNGKYREPEASVPAPAPVDIGASSKPDNTQEHSKAVVLMRAAAAVAGEVARFMPVMDMEQAVARREVLVRAVKELMVEGVDYGRITGKDGKSVSEKPTLLKPGANKLCNLFGLVIRYEFLERVEDWTGAQHGGEPFFRYLIKGVAYRGDFVMGEGVGECNSRESKYRWRQQERVCPQCGKANIRRSRNGGWYCWLKTDGCGASFEEGDERIEGQPVGRIPNPDIADQVNTIIKIAEKRSGNDTTINATSAAEFFTQDVEDFTPPADDIDTGGYPLGSSQAAAYVAKQKIARQDAFSQPAWKTMAEMAKAFEAIRELVGETEYYAELERWGWKRFQDLRADMDSPHPTNLELRPKGARRSDTISYEGCL